MIWDYPFKDRKNKEYYAVFYWDYFFAFFLRVTQPFFEDSDLVAAVPFFAGVFFAVDFFCTVFFADFFFVVAIFYENKCPALTTRQQILLKLSIPNLFRQFFSIISNTIDLKMHVTILFVS